LRLTPAAVKKDQMLTRLHVKGFKNLVETEVHFGPFTCVAGANAVGKSNLFDAIRFLSLLANGKLDEAARAIRAEGARNADIKSLFTRNADGSIGIMEFDLDMIVPFTAADDLRQEATASISFLNYKISLAYRNDPQERRRNGELELLSESLDYIKQGSAKERLAFPYAKTWLDSVMRGRKTSRLISTDRAEDAMVVTLHMDGLSRNAPNHKRGSGYKRLASQLPRTVLSAADADSPTVLCARAEMQRWEMVQLEPSAMRESDSIHQPPGISPAGGHMAATLYDLGRGQSPQGEDVDAEAAYQRVGNKLAELIGDVGSVRVDVDERRELLTIYLSDRFGAETSARSLSDGTLSFLALVLKQMEPHPQRLICLEEPENGIHPKRIDAILRLLRETAVDTNCAVDESNPLRQVIINTHSPAVVQQVPDESLIVADLLPWKDLAGAPCSRFMISVLSNTWRNKHFEKYRVVSKGSLLAYLRPAPRQSEDPVSATETRVIDRPDIQLMLNL
jgi:predicted ATPase